MPKSPPADLTVPCVSLSVSPALATPMAIEPDCVASEKFCLSGPKVEQPALRVKSEERRTTGCPECTVCQARSRRLDGC